MESPALISPSGAVREIDTSNLSTSSAGLAATVYVTSAVKPLYATVAFVAAVSTVISTSATATSVSSLPSVH